MKTFRNFDMLEAVELWAADNGCVSSEGELSELFDAEVAPHVVAQYGEQDQCAIDQAFNDWTDGLRADGIIHDEQYKCYCYVGKYAN